MIKVIHDSQFYSLKEIIEQGLILRGAIIAILNTDIQNGSLFLVVDTDAYAAYLDLETLQVYESLDFDREFGDYNFLIYKEPYIEVKLRKVD